MIASKSWQIHKLQSNVPDCPTIGIRPRSVRSQNAIPQNTGNAGTTQHPGNASTILCNPWDCGGIADSRQSNCNPVQSDLFCSPSQIPERSTQNRPRKSTITTTPRNANSDPNQHNQTRLQLDCETTEDCIVIGRIALKLHGLYVSQGGQERQSIEFGAIIGLPHRFRFRPATSHTAPTYHSKLITQSTQS